MNNIFYFKGVNAINHIFFLKRISWTRSRIIRVKPRNGNDNSRQLSQHFHICHLDLSFVSWFWQKVIYDYFNGYNSITGNKFWKLILSSWELNSILFYLTFSNETIEKLHYHLVKWKRWFHQMEQFLINSILFFRRHI